MNWFKVPWGHYAGPLWHAILVTVELTVVSFAGACIIGIVVALGRLSRRRILRGLSTGYVEVFRNLPLITGIYISYFGLTAVNILLTTFESGVLVLSLFYGSYLAEIFRGGMQGVPPGQREAGQALGFSRARVFGTVLLPQATRLALPATATMLVDLLKGTSLLVTIGGGELMTEATIITSVTYRAMEVYVVVGVIYLLMCFPLSRLSGVLERALRRGIALSFRSRRLRRFAAAQI